MAGNCRAVFLPSFGRTRRPIPSRTTGLVLQYRLRENQPRRRSLTPCRGSNEHPERLPSGTPRFPERPKTISELVSGPFGLPKRLREPPKQSEGLVSRARRAPENILGQHRVTPSGSPPTPETLGVHGGGPRRLEGRAAVLPVRTKQKPYEFPKSSGLVMGLVSDPPGPILEHVSSVALRVPKQS